MTAQLGPQGWEADPSQSQRLRVDPGAINFFKGLHFRSFLRLNIATGQKQVIKAVAPNNTILLDFNVQLKQGSLEVRTVTGPGLVEGGSFSTPLPIFSCNSMSIVPGFPVVPTPQVTLDTGGSIVSGGVERDVFFCQIAGQGNQAQASGAGQEDIRGVPGLSTFWFEFIASGTDSAIGVLHMRWEERP